MPWELLLFHRRTERLRSPKSLMELTTPMTPVGIVTKRAPEADLLKRIAWAVLLGQTALENEGRNRRILI